MKGMTPIVRNVSGLLSGFVMLYGMYVVCTGHLSPGGGFAGGVILMSGVVMLVLAYGGDRAREVLAHNRCHVLDGLGALAFAVLALLGLFLGGFFKNFLPLGQVQHLLSGGIILPANLAIALKVAAGLVGVFLALVLATRQAMPRE
jgi:multicomponent Na+:H+ antiporter subunit B